MNYSPEFEQWWNHYPRKVAKRKASKVFQTVLKEIGLVELIAITRKFAQSDVGRAGPFCPHPTTWLTQGRWEDEPDAWSLDQRPQPFKVVREYCKEEWRLPPAEEHTGESLRDQLAKAMRDGTQGEQI